MTHKLTAKQKMFCKEYIVDLNAKSAAIRAGYSENTAGVIGYENLNKPYLAEYIQQMMDKRTEKVEITAEQILNNILEIEKLAKKADKYNDALKANELLGKHLKLFSERIEITGDIGINFNGESNLKD